MELKIEKMNNLEIRQATLTVEGEGTQFVGTAATFEPYDMGEFREQIMPSAFESLTSYDVRALVNHDPNQLLARSKFGQGSLLLERTDRGLSYMFEIPDTQVGRDTKTLVERGDISGSSWAFVVAKDSWKMQEDGTPLRQIEQISELRDVSLVTYPANPDTSVALRSMQDNLNNKNQDEMDNLKKVTAPAVHGASGEHRNFNIIRAINGAINNRHDGLEAEMHQEGLKELKENNIEAREAHAFHMPSFMEMRDNTVTTGTQPAEGAALVETVKGRFIDALWANSPFLSRVSRFENLRGDIEFPRDQNVPALAFQTEIEEANVSTSTWDNVAFSPKRANILMHISNQLLKQEYSAGIQQRLTYQMTEATRVGLENALLNGDGVGANPTGIYTELAAQLITVGAGLDYDVLVDFEAALSAQDALNGNLGYVTHPDVVAFLKKSRVDAGSGILAVAYSERMQETMTANGYAIYNTTVSPVNTVPTPDEYGLLFGNLSDFAYCQWGGVSFMVDPYSLMSSSRIRLYTELHVDCGVLRPESFAISNDVQTGVG
jgi:HK97 family phage major capsid protein/HK97 family phage prohead protease